MTTLNATRLRTSPAIIWLRYLEEEDFGEED